MKRDFEHMYDLDSMDDAEIETLITEQLQEMPELDLDLVDIVVDAGFVELHGRVGTEQELQQIESVVTDVLGVSRYRNNIVIDELTRGQMSEAADEAVVQDAEVQDQHLGEDGEQTDPSAQHLMPNTKSQLYGTRDLQDAIEQGESYIPPDRPIQEGTNSRENH